MVRDEASSSVCRAGSPISVASEERTVSPGPLRVSEAVLSGHLGQFCQGWGSIPIEAASKGQDQLPGAQSTRASSPMAPDCGWVTDPDLAFGSSTRWQSRPPMWVYSSLSRHLLLHFSPEHMDCPASPLPSLHHRLAHPGHKVSGRLSTFNRLLLQDYWPLLQTQRPGTPNNIPMVKVKFFQRISMSPFNKK